ncbi:hypothetical protein BDW22DRAFT_1348700 [Trametopsis cervina]|nr:hypothetical protein BDW22DRAFT_1348700 [Trametopsis cervina]
MKSGASTGLRWPWVLTRNATYQEPSGILAVVVARHTTYCTQTTAFIQLEVAIAQEADHFVEYRVRNIYLALTANSGIYRIEAIDRGVDRPCNTCGWDIWICDAPQRLSFQPTPLVQNRLGIPPVTTYVPVQSISKASSRQRKAHVGDGGRSRKHTTRKARRPKPTPTRPPSMTWTPALREVAEGFYKDYQAARVGQKIDVIRNCASKRVRTWFGNRQKVDETDSEDEDRTTGSDDERDTDATDDNSEDDESSPAHKAEGGPSTNVDDFDVSEDGSLADGILYNDDLGTVQSAVESDVEVDQLIDDNEVAQDTLGNEVAGNPADANGETVGGPGDAVGNPDNANGNPVDADGEAAANLADHVRTHEGPDASSRQTTPTQNADILIDGRVDAMTIPSLATSVHAFTLDTSAAVGRAITTTVRFNTTDDAVHIMISKPVSGVMLDGQCYRLLSNTSDVDSQQPRVNDDGVPTSPSVAGPCTDEADRRTPISSSKSPDTRGLKRKRGNE